MTERITLTTPLSKLPGVGPAYQARLKRLGLSTADDLLRYFPRRYDDLREIKDVADLQEFGAATAGAVITVRATLQKIAARRTRGGRALITARLGNERGSLEAVWFNQPYLARQLTAGEEYVFSGKLRSGYGRLSLQNPTVEASETESLHLGRLVPVYPETEGVSSRWLRAKITELLPLAEKLTDELPESIRDHYDLLPLSEAIRQIHFPDSPEAASRARYRHDFAQLFLIQLATQQNRRAWRRETAARRIPYDPTVVKRLTARLPWELTEDQRRAAHQILTDLDAETPMMRLLEGDVGSGKTAVAALALHQTAAAGYQGALMTPTEVLARQHAATLAAWLKPLGQTVTLLLGSQTASERRRTEGLISGGSPGVIVGTQALIQEGVDWPALALAVVDEQHRFGVEQRRALRGQYAPHLLSMTATPIPRSLALVAYGDQDLSILEQVPAGRSPIATQLAGPGDRSDVFRAVGRHLAAGRQAFVVYPVIDQSVAGRRSAVAEYERLAGEVFRDYRVGLLHGRLSSEAKQAVMQRFADGQLDILVSTTVIEVGVDIPNATVMVIEEAQQFGLAQLHQLRGRVGRGSAQSYCYLIAGSDSAEDNQRLAALTDQNSGFGLAELDLAWRGPGELLGTRQSGFSISIEALTDRRLLTASRQAAETVLSGDSQLAGHPVLAERLSSVWRPD